MRPLEPLDVPLEGVRLLEASAGTGKTWTIAGLYLRLLLERGLEVPEILVVTFTQAATEELRERIRGRVRAALAVAEGRAEGDELVAGLLARAAPGSDPSQRLADALARMDELAVFTIHGFCQRVLQDNAFESGALFDAELGADERELRRTVIEDFWRRRLYGASPFEATRLLAEWPDPATLGKEVAALVGPERIELLPEVDARAAERALEAAWSSARREWAEGREAVRALLESGVLNRTSYKPARVAQALAEADRHLGAGGQDLASRPPTADARPPVSATDPCVGTAGDAGGGGSGRGEQGAPEGQPAGGVDALGPVVRVTPSPPDPDLLGLLTPARLARATLKGKVTPAHPFFDACAAWLAAEAEAARARRVALLREAAEYVGGALDRRKAERRVLFFDDLLVHLDRALAGPAGDTLAERLRRQYPAALIDEFQDTDPVQYRIFRRVYAGAEGTALFLIGDPKQAIYGFRGADVFTYLQAGRDVDPDADRFTLTRNWRSSTPFVEAVNALFARAERPFLFEAIPFHPVVAAGKGDEAPLEIDGRAPAPLAIWLLGREPAEPGKSPGVLAKGKAQAQAAAACAEAIAELLDQGEAGRARLEGRNLEARDLAVLVRDRHEAEAVRRALARVGVASVYYSRESVFATEEAGELARVLAAVATPEDAGALRAALATRLLGRSAAEIEALAADERAWEATAERFRAWAAHWQARGLMPALLRLVDEEGVAGRLLAGAGGERRLTNLLQLGELLQEAAAARPGFEAALRELAAAREGAEGEIEAQQLRLESDEDLVRVVTLHRSKGLEYPVVFLPFPWAAKPAGSDPPLRFHDPETGALRADLARPPDPGHAALAERERLAEDLRLLYVGLTRARYRCTLTWGAVNGADASALAYLLHGPEEGRLTLADQKDGGTRLQRPDTPPRLPLADQEDVVLREALGALAAEAGGRIEVGDLPPERGLRRRAGPAAGPALAARAFGGRIDRSWRVASYSGLVSGRESERPDHDAVGALSAEREGLAYGPGGLGPDVPGRDASQDSATALSRRDGRGSEGQDRDAVGAEGQAAEGLGPNLPGLGFGAPAEARREAPGPAESAPDAAPAHDRGALTFFDFPRGARAGTCLHALLESLDFPAARGEALDRAVTAQLARFGFAPEWAAVVAVAVADLLDTPLDVRRPDLPGNAHDRPFEPEALLAPETDRHRQPAAEVRRLPAIDRMRWPEGEGLRLRAIDRARRLDELEFWYPLAGLTAPGLEGTLARFAGYRSEGPRLTFSPVRGLMHGYLDLVFEWEGRYYLADYKSNHLGSRPEDYAPEHLAAAMTEHRYDLQYLVYTVALHRFLATRRPDYDYDRHFGGAYYLFLRGLRAQAGPAYGVFFDRPPRALVEALDALFAGTPAGAPRPGVTPAATSR